MAGSKLVRFLLIRNNPSCKTPEADYPRAFLPALEALTSCLAFEEDYPRDFLHTLGVLASSQTSEEAYPRAFLQASEVSHPPKLPKKSTQGLSFKPWLFSPPPKLPKKTTRGLFFKPRKSHILPFFRRRLPKGFPSNLGSLTSSQTSEEEYPRAFLQASEVSHPPKLSKKTTQGE